MAMTTAFRFAVALALAAVSSATLTAQEPERPEPPPIVPTAFAQAGSDSLPFDSLTSGMLVRMTAPGIIHRRMGVIESRFGDTLVIRGVHERELVRVDRGRIEWAQVSSGRELTKWRIFQGAALGAVTGVMIASLVQYGLHREDRIDACPIGFSGLDCGISQRYLISGVAAGAAIGMVVASRRPGHRWRDVFVRLAR